MATFFKHASFSVRGCSRRIPQRLTTVSTASWVRPFSSSFTNRRDDLRTPAEGKTNPEAELEEFMSGLSKRTLQNLFESEAPGFRDRPDDTFDYGEDEVDPDEFDIDKDPEDDPLHTDFEGDDMTSLGHAQLEQHRELREFARIAAWELPLLSKLAKPFEPPSKDSPLRFRYTTYMGEKHPAANKVVVEFCPSDLPDLTQQQRNKLIKLTGARYNPDTDIVKMSCESFSTQAQNKRYLGDLMDSLIHEAKDGKDTFEDVPFDFRHHKPKRRFEYPKDWLMTPERRKVLDDRRNAQQLLDQQREAEGKLLNGAEIIDKELAAPVRKPALESVAALSAATPKRSAKRAR